MRAGRKQVQPPYLQASNVKKKPFSIKLMPFLLYYKENTFVLLFQETMATKLLSVQITHLSHLFLFHFNQTDSITELRPSMLSIRDRFFKHLLFKKLSYTDEVSEKKRITIQPQLITLFIL